MRHAGLSWKAGQSGTVKAGRFRCSTCAWPRRRENGVSSIFRPENRTDTIFLTPFLHLLVGVLNLVVVDVKRLPIRRPTDHKAARQGIPKLSNARIRHLGIVD